MTRRDFVKTVAVVTGATAGAITLPACSIPPGQSMPAPVQKTARYTPNKAEVEYWCRRLQEVYGFLDAGEVARHMAARLQ